MPRRRLRVVAVVTAAWPPLLLSVAALALAGGRRDSAEAWAGHEPKAPPTGVVHGWVSPSGTRVLVPADVCDEADPLMSLALEGRISSRSSGGTEHVAVRLEPPEAFATGAAIDRGEEVMVLDVGPGLARRGLASTEERPVVYTAATARCRSWSEQRWDLGALSATRVDGRLAAGEALSAYVVPQPTHTGVLAILLLHSHARPVTLRSVTLADAGSTTGVVLAATGWMEHWEAWKEEALAWRDAHAPPQPTAPLATRVPRSVAPTDPAPPLTWRRMDDLGLRMGPYNAAVVVIGEWTFARSRRPPSQTVLGRASRMLRPLTPARPRVVLSFPVLSLRVDGAVSTVGITDPVYAELP